MCRKTELANGILLEIMQGDITKMDTDVIVNAANKQLMHGGGVAAAIARRGGQPVQEESRWWVREKGPISAGKPAVTTGGDLACKYVIHAVGPIWGEGDEEDTLALAIRSSLSLAEELKAKSISFPAISTGIYGFPTDHAADIFMRVLAAAGSERVRSVRRIIIVLFDRQRLDVFCDSFNQHFEREAR